MSDRILNGGEETDQRLIQNTGPVMIRVNERNRIRLAGQRHDELQLCPPCRTGHHQTGLSHRNEIKHLLPGKGAAVNLRRLQTIKIRMEEGTINHF